MHSIIFVMFIVLFPEYHSAENTVDLLALNLEAPIPPDMPWAHDLLAEVKGYSVQGVFIPTQPNSTLPVNNAPENQRPGTEGTGNDRAGMNQSENSGENNVPWMSGTGTEEPGNDRPGDDAPTDRREEIPEPSPPRPPSSPPPKAKGPKRPKPSRESSPLNPKAQPSGNQACKLAVYVVGRLS